MSAALASADALWRVFLTLPITTQFAVTLLLVSGVIIHVFAYNERTIHEGPSIFTTSGIFFTFLGIAEGLYGFDPQKIDASIPALLDGLKTAFIASVVGVGMALSIKMRYALFGLRRNRSSVKSDGATIQDLLDQMVAVQQALVGDDDSTLLSQAKLIRQDSNDRLDRLRQSQAEFMQRMADNNSKALIQALQEVIRDFNTKISEQFGSNFRQLNEAVGRLLVWQENYRAQLTDLIEQQKRSSASMQLAADRYEALVSKAETFTKTAEQLSELLRGLETQKAQLTESSRALATLLVKASDGLPNVERKIVELTEQVSFGVKQNQDEMTKVIQRASSSLADNVAQLNSEMAAALQKSNAQVNDHLRQLSEKTTEQITKLDLALETELSKSISTLGRQLTALSGRFVEDYTPLTEKLRALIQVAQRG